MTKLSFLVENYFSIDGAQARGSRGHCFHLASANGSFSCFYQIQRGTARKKEFFYIFPNFKKKKKKKMERGIGKTKKYDICSTKDVSSR